MPRSFCPSNLVFEGSLDIFSCVIHFVRKQCQSWSPFSGINHFKCHIKVFMNAWPTGVLETFMDHLHTRTQMVFMSIQYINNKSLQSSTKLSKAIKAPMDPMRIHRRTQWVAKWCTSRAYLMMNGRDSRVFTYSKHTHIHLQAHPNHTMRPTILWLIHVLSDIWLSNLYSCFSWMLPTRLAFTLRLWMITMQRQPPVLCMGIHPFGADLRRLIIVINDHDQFEFNYTPKAEVNKGGATINVQAGYHTTYSATL